MAFVHRSLRHTRTHAVRVRPVTILCVVLQLTTRSPTPTFDASRRRRFAESAINFFGNVANEMRQQANPEETLTMRIPSLQTRELRQHT